MIETHKDSHLERRSSHPHLSSQVALGNCICHSKSFLIFSCLDPIGGNASGKRGKVWFEGTVDFPWPHAFLGSCCLVTKSCPALLPPSDCSPPGSSVHGISQATILEWVAISSSGDRPDPRMEPSCPALAGGFSTTEPPGEPS